MIITSFVLLLLQPNRWHSKPPLPVGAEQRCSQSGVYLNICVCVGGGGWRGMIKASRLCSTHDNYIWKMSGFSTLKHQLRSSGCNSYFEKDSSFCGENPPSTPVLFAHVISRPLQLVYNLVRNDIKEPFPTCKLSLMNAGHGWSRCLDSHTAQALMPWSPIHLPPPPSQKYCFNTGRCTVTHVRHFAWEKLDLNG